MLGDFLMRQSLDNKQVKNGAIGRRQLPDGFDDLFIGKDVNARLLLVGDIFRIIGQHLPVDIGGVLSIVIDTGVDKDALEPTLQRRQHVRMSGLLELMNVLEKLDESFIHDFFHLFKVILITVANFDSIILEQII